jgi:hypothetical protein
LWGFTCEDLRLSAQLLTVSAIINSSFCRDSVSQALGALRVSNSMLFGDSAEIIRDQTLGPPAYMLEQMYKAPTTHSVWVKR